MIKQKAYDLGFDIVGITSADPVDDIHIAALKKWLAGGFQASMGYMCRNIDKRTDPSKLLTGAKSVICVALSYKVAHCRKKNHQNKAIVADFALYQDYHDFIKQRLFVLADFLKQNSSSQTVKFKACVDSVPLAERAFAQRAGLGFIGKNRMLINPALGSNLFLAELISNLELESDKPMESQCYQCDKCLKACPTGALSDSDGLDANKCASYLTIEHRLPIHESNKPGIGNSLFGCDKCSSQCPYDIKAPQSKNSELQLFEQSQAISPNLILDWTQQDFDRLFKGTPVERLGLELLKRNAKICAANIRRSCEK